MFKMIKFLVMKHTVYYGGSVKLHPETLLALAEHIKGTTADLPVFEIDPLMEQEFSSFCSQRGLIPVKLYTPKMATNERTKELFGEAWEKKVKVMQEKIEKNKEIEKVKRLRKLEEAAKLLKQEGVLQNGVLHMDELK